MKQIFILLTFSLVVWSSILLDNLYAADPSGNALKSQVARSWTRTVILDSWEKVRLTCAGWNCANSDRTITSTTSIDWNRTIYNIKGNEATCESNVGCVWQAASTAEKIEETLRNTSTSGWPIKVFTTEKIPWSICTCVADGAQRTEDINGNTINPGIGEVACWNMVTRKYVCTVQPWLWNFQAIFADIVRYLVNIVLLLWVLAIVGLGIAWTWAGGDDVKAKSTLKTWGINIVVGLIILFMFQYILKFIAPWIYQ